MNFFTIGARERIKENNYLLRLGKLIRWGCIEKLLRGIHVNEENSKGGPKAYNNLAMFKALLLGQWHSLSPTFPAPQSTFSELTHRFWPPLLQTNK